MFGRNRDPKPETGSSARITRQIREQNTPAFADGERRANPQPHKVDKSVLRAPATKRGR